MLNDESLKEQMAGTTAITVLIKDDKLFCANAGDSRAIGCKNGEVESLSFDHKPNNPDEMDRIYRAGGWVELNRVNGNLALSRALGDFVFKKNKQKSAEQQIVTGNAKCESFFSIGFGFCATGGWGLEAWALIRLELLGVFGVSLTLLKFI